MIATDPSYSEAVAKLIADLDIAIEDLTKKQLGEAIVQAIASGDFMRHIRADGAQTVTYVPFRERENLLASINTLKGLLEEHGIPLPNNYDELR